MMKNRPKAKLIVKRGQHAGCTYEVTTDKAVVIGRDSSCDIQFFDKGLSRNHSRIETEGNRFVISDLESTNGTFVNGKMIIRKPLDSRDIIRMGKIELQFIPEDGPVSTVSSSNVKLVDDPGQGSEHTIARRMDIDSVTFEKTLAGSSVGLKVAIPQTDSALLGNYKKALSTIHEVSTSMSQIHDKQALYDRLIEVIMGVIKAERGFIVLRDPAGGDFAPVASHTGTGQRADEFLTISRSIVRKTIEEGLSILSSDAMADDRFSTEMSIIMHAIRSVMCVPLESQGRRILGAIYVDSRGTANHFFENDLELLSILGLQAGSAVERIELTEHFVAKQKIQQALDFAKQIQSSFLPKDIPQSVNLDIVGWSESCDETGGDYYDFIEQGEGSLGLVIGDVSGHGVGAALLMATARAFLRALATKVDDPGELLSQVNSLLEQDLEDDQFMTFFYGNLDLNGFQMRYASAGHESPLIYRKATNDFETLESTGIPLGMMPGFAYEEGPKVSFSRGDILLLYTDGIIEAMDGEREEYGRERFREVIRANAAKSSNQIIKSVYDDVLAFCGGSPQRDDLTLAVCKFVAKYVKPSEETGDGVTDQDFSKTRLDR